MPGDKQLAIVSLVSPTSAAQKDTTAYVVPTNINQTQNYCKCMICPYATVAATETVYIVCYVVHNGLSVGTINTGAGLSIYQPEEDVLFVKVIGLADTQASSSCVVMNGPITRALQGGDQVNVSAKSSAAGGTSAYRVICETSFRNPYVAPPQIALGA